MGVRISALPALTTLTADDITVFVNEVGGANPVTSKVNFQDLKNSVLSGTALDAIQVNANGDVVISGGTSGSTLIQGTILQNTATNNFITGDTLYIDANTTFDGNNFTMNTHLQNYGNTTLGTPYQVAQTDSNGDPVTDENGDQVFDTVTPVTQIDGTFVINASANVVGLSLLDLDNANGDNIADGTADQVLSTDGSGNFKFTNSLPFGSVDLSTTPDGSSLVYNDGVYGTATWSHANPFTVTLSEEHHFSNGDIATIDADDQTYDGQSYYVGVVNSTHIGFYSDPALTAPIDGSGFSATPNTDATVTQTDGAQFEPRSLNLNDLGNVNATPTNGQVLTWNGSSNLWYGADSTGGGGSEAGGGVDVDSTSLVDGDTIVWDDQRYTIVDLIDDPNDATKIIIDFGTQAHGQIGASAWGIFNGSGGSTELNLSEYHKIVQIDANAATNSYYTLSFGNATSDTVSDTDLASNTSAWTSGGYFQTVVTVDGATSNTDGKWIATAQSELTAPDLTSSSIGELTDVETASAGHVPSDGQVLTWHASMSHWMPMDVSIPGSANTGGVPITNPEANLGAGDQLTWSDGIVGRGQIGGITNTGTQPTYVTSSELGHEVEFSRPGTPVIMPSPDPADYFTPGSTLAQIDAADYERVVGRFLDLHDSGTNASSALNGVYLELTTATSTVANSNPEGTGKRRYHMIKLDQSTRARLTHANGEYQVYEAPSGSQDINSVTVHDADARFERVDIATGTAKQGWVALPNPEADISDSPLGELKDVDVSGVADGNIIKYNAANTTYVAASLDDVLESTGAPVMYGPGGEKANTALFNEGDTLTWDNQQYTMSAVSLADPAVVTLSGDHTLQDGAYIQITGVVGMTELNSNFYYVNAISNTEVELYTDAGLTTGVDSVGFTAYTSGGTLAGPGNWSVGSGATTLGALTDVDLSTVTNDRRFLAYNTSSQNWVPASGAEIAGNGGQPGMTGGNIYIDPDNITNGQTLTWIDHEFDIVDISEANNQLYVDFGSTAHAKDQIGTASWVVFDMSGAVGATELDYQTGVWHFLTQVNADPSVNSHYAVTTGNIFSSDTLTQYLGPNTSAWTSGGKIIKVNGSGANSVGGFIATTASSGGGGGASVTVSDTAPSGASSGDLWWESDTGRLKIYYNDGTSSQWVDSTTSSTAADKNIFNQTTQEKTNIVANAGSGGKDYDCSSAGIHHLSNIAGDIDANLTNLSLQVGYSTTVTFVLNQSSSAKVVKTLSIGGTSQTIKWVGGVVPTGTASGVDAMSFSLIRTGTSSYTVLGQLVPFS